MIYRIVFVLALLLTPVIASAEDVPGGELQVSPSYMRWEGVNLYGWQAALNSNIRSWVGLAVEGSGHYSTSNGDLLSIYTLRGGPQFSFVRNDCLTGFAHGLIGGGFLRDSFPVTGQTSLTVHQNGFSAAVGGGLDLNLTDTLALRFLQIDYDFYRFGTSNTHDVRATAGIVIRFK